MKTQKMSGDSHNPQTELLAKLQKEMPEVFSEGKIDFSKFKATLGEDSVAEGERYGLSWAGKSDCFRQIQETTTNTLKPCREESVNFDESDNLFIEGDNLQAMKVLQKSYYGKVKMIYIDPPYNTGNDFIYNDKFSQAKKEYLQEIGAIDELGNVVNAELFRQNTRDSGHFHSTWLNMMYPRLFLARNLLRQDGVIFVSIDDNEVANLRKMMDEIFGEEGFVGQIVWKNVTDNNPTNIVVEHEYLVCYSRSKDVLEGVWKSSNSTIKNMLIEKGEALIKKHGADEEKLQQEYTKWFRDNKQYLGELDRYKYIDKGGIYTGSQSVHNPGREGYRYDVIHPKTNKPCKQPLFGYRFPKKTMDEYLESGRVLFGEDESKILELKLYASDFKDKLSSFFRLDGRLGSNEVRAIFEKKIFDNPKPMDLLKRFISFVLQNDDIILDFFAGSGTTAHAVAQLNADDGGNRKWICIQLPEKCKEESEAAKAGYVTIADIAKERIRRASWQIFTKGTSTIKSVFKIAEGDTAELKKERERFDKWIADNPKFGFKVFKLKESNFKVWNTQIENVEQLEQQMIDFLDNVREGATTEDLLYELVLKSGHELNVPIEEKKADGQSYFRIGDGMIVICLADKMTKPLFEAIAKDKPEKIITLDRVFGNNDQLKTNILLQAEHAGVKEFKVI